MFRYKTTGICQIEVDILVFNLGSNFRWKALQHYTSWVTFPLLNCMDYTVVLLYRSPSNQLSQRHVTEDTRGQPMSISFSNWQSLLSSLKPALIVSITAPYEYNTNILYLQTFLFYPLWSYSSYSIHYDPILPILSIMTLFYPLLSYSIHHDPILSIMILFYPLWSYSIHDPTLSIMILFYPLWSYSIHYDPNLSIMILLYQSWSYSIHYDPILSIMVLFYPSWITPHLQWFDLLLEILNFKCLSANTYRIVDVHQIHKFRNERLEKCNLLEQKIIWTEKARWSLLNLRKEQFRTDKAIQ
jgi:hypothetical protein